MEKYNFTTPYEELLLIVNAHGSDTLKAAIKLKAVEKALSTKSASLTPLVEEYLLAHSDTFTPSGVLAEKFGSSLACISGICRKLGCETCSVIVVKANGKETLNTGYKLTHKAVASEDTVEAEAEA